MKLSLYPILVDFSKFDDSNIYLFTLDSKIHESQFMDNVLYKTINDVSDEVEIFFIQAHHFINIYDSLQYAIRLYINGDQKARQGEFESIFLLKKAGSVL